MRRLRELLIISLAASNAWTLVELRLSRRDRTVLRAALANALDVCASRSLGAGRSYWFPGRRRDDRPVPKP